MWVDLSPKVIGERFKVVDVHTHIGYFPGFNVGIDVDGLVKLLQDYKIRYAIVFSYDNEAVAKAIRGHKELYGMVWVNPRDHKTIEFMKKHVKDPKFVGIKLHPLLDGYLPDDPVVHPIVELAMDASWKLLIHCGHPPFSLPWSIERLAERFPKQPIILGHMGHGHIVYVNGSLEVASRRKNIYLEPSGMPMHVKIREAVAIAGVKRVLWGSDTPFHHPAVELMKLQAAELSENELRLVLGENAVELFGLE